MSNGVPRTGVSSPSGTGYAGRCMSLRRGKDPENRDHRAELHDWFRGVHSPEREKNDDDPLLPPCFDRRPCEFAPLPSAPREGTCEVRERHRGGGSGEAGGAEDRSEEHTSEL